MSASTSATGSVNYGRYIISYDYEDRMWNADPKRRYVKIKNELMEYTYPPTRTYVEPTISGLQNSMRKDGVGRIHCRKHEWIVDYIPNDLRTTE